MDIIERLRNNCSCNIDSTPCGAEEQCRNAYEAADEIERLREALRWAAPYVKNEPRVDAIVKSALKESK